MYSNLEAELRRQRITRHNLAKMLNMSVSTLSLKLNGKSDISIRLALEIKSLLGVDLPLDTLFSIQQPQQSA